MSKRTFLKIIILLGILLILLVIIVVAIIYPLFKKDKESSLKVKETKTEEGNFALEEIKNCRKNILENFAGKWQNYETEGEGTFYIEFKENGKFMSNGWGVKETIEGGLWETDGNTVTLDFDDENETWDSAIIEPEGTDPSGSIVEFNDSANVVKFNVDYTEMTQDHTGECPLNKFFINILGYYLFKIS